MSKYVLESESRELLSYEHPLWKAAVRADWRKNLINSEAASSVEESSREEHITTATISSLKVRAHSDNDSKTDHEDYTSSGSVEDYMSSGSVEV